jgi:orotate phosphoribosyltransferase
MSHASQRFLQLALHQQALRFGEFTLKSGRVSPYFFNAGLFNTGQALATLGECYAETVINQAPSFDMLFGPAYKGIPLASACAIGLANKDKNLPLAFNRKEAKTHGEGGRIMGAPLQGRVLIVDDVITAGTAIRESIEIIREAGAQPAGVVIALDRQERGAHSPLSAAQEVQQDFAIPVLAIANLNDLLNAAHSIAEIALHKDALLAYRAQYGIEG